MKKLTDLKQRLAEPGAFSDIYVDRATLARLVVVADIARRFVPPSGTIQWELRETDLRDALTALEGP